MTKITIPFAEIGRYLFVGGLAFLAESLTLIVFREFWLNSNLTALGFNIDLMISTVFGFIVGLSINYVLSVSYVFQNFNNIEARKIKGFIQFLVIGTIGLALKAFGMNFMVEVIGLFYLIMSLILSVYSLFIGYVLSRDFLISGIVDVQSGIFISVLYGLVAVMFIAFTFLIVKVF
jgi:putative flippase GtrA